MKINRCILKQKHAPKRPSYRHTKGNLYDSPVINKQKAKNTPFFKFDKIYQIVFWYFMVEKYIHVVYEYSL